MQSRLSSRTLRAPSLLTLSFTVLACGNSDPSISGGGSNQEPGGKTADAGRDARTNTINRDGGGLSGRDASFMPVDPSCVNLQCQQVTCDNGGDTTISGIVFDPAGRNPLYNVAVYVPNTTPDELKSGASCDSCDSLYTGNAIASALTDAQGRFTIKNAPAGDNIPLVVQVGKWRRQLTIPTVASCTDNAQPDGDIRLPRNSQEGDIPKIAVSTGGADTLECLLRRVGVDASEFVAGGSQTGRVHIFPGGVSPGSILGIPINVNASPNTNPPGPASAMALWNSTDSLKQYDLVLLSCEGSETTNPNRDALHEYTNAGGRVFASHFHYAWFNKGPYSTENLATWHDGARPINDRNGTRSNIVTTLPNGMPFVKGQALHDWLSNVNALNNGQLILQDAKYNADVTPDNIPSQAWITTDQSSMSPNATEYFSFNTPVLPPGTDGALVCGRVVFSALHVGAASNDSFTAPVPQSCSNGELSPQEKALEFMLFDLSSCVTPDAAPPTPPPVMIF